jgi:hypothetical protein
VLVVSPVGEYDLAHGALTIGRSGYADITLDDPLVSRTHARIVVLDEGHVAIEDLHSTNGVYVNGARCLGKSQNLRDGDRLLVGTSELGVFAQRAPVSTSFSAQHPARSARTSEVPPATDRGDTLEVIARVAEDLHARGNAADAVRLLSSRLNEVLLGASAGRWVPDALLERASGQATVLFTWTQNGAWLDYIVELHLALQKPPSERLVATLESAHRSGALRYDAQLLRCYLDGLERQRAAMTPSDEARRSRLHALLR